MQFNSFCILMYFDRNIYHIGISLGRFPKFFLMRHLSHGLVCYIYQTTNTIHFYSSPPLCFILPFCSEFGRCCCVCGWREFYLGKAKKQKSLEFPTFESFANKNEKLVFQPKVTCNSSSRLTKSALLFMYYIPPLIYIYIYTLIYNFFLSTKILIFLIS